MISKSKEGSRFDFLQWDLSCLINFFAFVFDIMLYHTGDPKSRNDGTTEWRNHGTAENHPKS